MVLSRSFIADAREASAHSFLIPWRQNSLSLYDSFTQKMVLKRPFISDTGESPGRQLLGQYCSFTGKMCTKGCSLLTQEKPQLYTFIVQVSGRQSFESVQ